MNYRGLLVLGFLKRQFFPPALLYPRTNKSTVFAKSEIKYDPIVTFFVSSYWDINYAMRIHWSKPRSNIKVAIISVQILSGYKDTLQHIFVTLTQS